MNYNELTTAANKLAENVTKIEAPSLIVPSSTAAELEAYRERNRLRKVSDVGASVDVEGGKIICVSTACIRGNKIFFQNRFYFHVEGKKYRSQFSQAKAKAALL